MVGVYLSTVIGWYKRYSMEGMSGLKSKVCVRRYLSGWAPALAKEWQLRSVIVGENPKQLTLPFVEPLGCNAVGQGAVQHRDADSYGG